MSYELLYIQPDPIQISQTSAHFPQTPAFVRNHEQALESESNTHPGIRDLPGLIEHMRADCGGTDFQPRPTGQNVNGLTVNGGTFRLKNIVIHTSIDQFQFLEVVSLI